MRCCSVPSPTQSLNFVLRAHTARISPHEQETWCRVAAEKTVIDAPHSEVREPSFQVVGKTRHRLRGCAQQTAKPDCITVRNPKPDGEMMNRRVWITVFEWLGSALGIIYAILIASNTGNEILAFALLLTSATLFSGWAVIDRKWAFLALQVFYAGSAILGFVRWS